MKVELTKIVKDKNFNKTKTYKSIKGFVDLIMEKLVSKENVLKEALSVKSHIIYENKNWDEYYIQDKNSSTLLERFLISRNFHCNEITYVFNFFILKGDKDLRDYVLNNLVKEMPLAKGFESNCGRNKNLSLSLRYFPAKELCLIEKFTGENGKNFIIVNEVIDGVLNESMIEDFVEDLIKNLFFSEETLIDYKKYQELQNIKKDFKTIFNIFIEQRKKSIKEGILMLLKEI